MSARPYFADDAVTVHHGDCLHVMATLPDASVDAVVTDPPYGLGFMGQKWDTYANETGRAPAAGAKFDHVGGNHNPSNAADAARTRRVESQRFGEWCEQWTAECLRVLKPGGYLLAFGGSRTWHRLTVAVEDAGFEVRDSIAWLYGSGFPKSLDVSKAIDKAAGAERETVTIPNIAIPSGQSRYLETPGRRQTAETGGPIPITDAARTWQGWGTALKPAFEPIVVARKPLAGTVAGNVLAHGTGALNIDATRIPSDEPIAAHYGTKGGDIGFTKGGAGGYQQGDAAATPPNTAGRWPTNVVLDGHAADELDRQSGTLTSGANPTRRGSDKFRDAYGDFQGQEECTPVRGADSGGASRFFPTFRYEAKAPTAERPRHGEVAHPTVKPLDLMRWLVRLVTPPGGTVLEPFAGSGTTAEACVIEGFRCIAIEREAAYLPLIVARLSKPIQPDLFGGAA